MQSSVKRTALVLTVGAFAPANRIWRSHNDGVPGSIPECFQAAGNSGRGTGNPIQMEFIETDIKNLEKQLDSAGAPPTPRRLPDWKGGK